MIHGKGGTGLQSNVKITIIIPAYNAEKSLYKCVTSVVSQTFDDIQIILIDDGSVDKTYDMCKELQQMDKRIEVYHTENKGSVCARKMGLELAIGDYIGFVDADDYIEPDMFQKLLQRFIDTGADFIHSGYIEENGRERKIVCDFEDSILDMESTEDRIRFLQEYVLGETKDNYISSSIWSKLFKRELIRKCYGELPDEQQYGEDLLCLCRCIFESKRIALYKRAGYHYVIGKSTLSHLKYDNYMRKEIGLWYHILKLADEYGCTEVLSNEIYYFLKKRMLHVVWSDKKEKLPIPRYYYKDIEKVYEKKVVIFGAGDVGQDYYAQISKYKCCEIVAWVDSNWDKYHFSYAEVTAIDDIRDNLYYDVILIAVREKKVGMEIKKLLTNRGISDEKIEWKEPERYY